MQDQINPKQLQELLYNDIQVTNLWPQIVQHVAAHPVGQRPTRRGWQFALLSVALVLGLVYWVPRLQHASGSTTAAARQLSGSASAALEQANLDNLDPSKYENARIWCPDPACSEPPIMTMPIVVDTTGGQPLTPTVDMHALMMWCETSNTCIIERLPDTELCTPNTPTCSRIEGATNSYAHTPESVWTDAGTLHINRDNYTVEYAISGDQAIISDHAAFVDLLRSWRIRIQSATSSTATTWNERAADIWAIEEQTTGMTGTVLIDRESHTVLGWTLGEWRIEATQFSGQMLRLPQVWERVCLEPVTHTSCQMLP